MEADRMSINPDALWWRLRVSHPFERNLKRDPGALMSMLQISWAPSNLRVTPCRSLGLKYPLLPNKWVRYWGFFLKKLYCLHKFRGKNQTPRADLHPFGASCQPLRNHLTCQPADDIWFIKASFHWARGTTQKTTWLQENPSQNSAWHLCHDQWRVKPLRLQNWEWVEADELENKSGHRCGKNGWRSLWESWKETKGPDVAEVSLCRGQVTHAAPQGALLPLCPSLCQAPTTTENPPPWVGIVLNSLSTSDRRRWALSGAWSINTG